MFPLEQLVLHRRLHLNHFESVAETMLKAVRIVRQSGGIRHLTTDLSRAAAVPQLTKICATIGPASEQLPMLQQVVTAGMRIMRLNFSHATYEEADLRMKNLKLSPGKNNVPNNLNLRAVMLDTQGPEIRTGSFAGDVKEITWETGRKVGSNSVTCRLCCTCLITAPSNKTMEQS
jgi:Pyruvate kinase, barrel domain